MKNPERMEKVALSMCRIQTVMSERRIEFKSRSDKQWLDKRNTERAQRKTIRNKISAHKNQPKTCPSVLQPKRMIGLSNFRKQMMSKGVKPRKVEQEDDVTDDDFAPPKEGEKMAEHKVNIELQSLCTGRCEETEEIHNVDSNY